MNKSSPTPSLNHPPLDEDWSSHPAVEWLFARKNLFLGVFLFLIAILLIASRLISWRTQEAEKDFFQAQTNFTQFEQDAATPHSSIATTNLEQLQEIMKRHPELKAKYEGSLAQTLLITKETALAQPFIDDIFTRTQPDHLELYKNYTQTSLLIGQGKYGDALQNAIQLKSTLDQQQNQQENQQEKSKNSVLYFFNLVRMAILYEQLGQPQEELKTWNEIQNQMGRSPVLLSANGAYQVGNVSLEQYIEERKHSLMK